MSLSVVLVLLHSPNAFAQGLATASGQVTDQTAGAVPDADVEIKDVDTGLAQTTKTNAGGFYRFLALKPGRYQMTVRKESFEAVTVTGMVLNVGETLSRDVVLKVGSVTQSVTVTAGTSHVNTTDAGVSSVIDRATVENMPLNGRSFQSLLELTPGINAINPMSVTPANVQSAQGQFTVNGQRPDANYFIVDGVSANTGASSGGVLGQSGTGSLPAQGSHRSGFRAGTPLVRSFLRRDNLPAAVDPHEDVGESKTHLHRSVSGGHGVQTRHDARLTVQPNTQL